jgi:RES domain-containing protein
MDRGLANAVAGTAPTSVEGTFFRHAYIGIRDLKASTGGGRWGPIGSYPVLYLGAPEPTIVAEAYRLLVDGVEGMRPELVGPRNFFTVEVRVTNLLDLRVSEHREAVGLGDDALRGRWEPCQRVGAAAHQLGMHGVIAPAATGLGMTLALFEHTLPAAEWPVILSRTEWAKLPPDPRVLQVVERIEPS